MRTLQEMLEIVVQRAIDELENGEEPNFRDCDLVAIVFRKTSKDICDLVRAIYNKRIKGN